MALDDYGDYGEAAYDDGQYGEEGYDSYYDPSTGQPVGGDGNKGETFILLSVSGFLWHSHGIFSKRHFGVKTSEMLVFLFKKMS